MLTKYAIGQQNYLLESELALQEVQWIDLEDPSQTERDLVEKALNISLPLHHEVHQIEFSNRFYVENSACYASIQVITKAAPTAESHMITLILTHSCVITLHYSTINTLDKFYEKATHNKLGFKDHYMIYLSIIEELVGQVADLFELIDEETDLLALNLVKTVDTKKHNDHSKNLNQCLREINMSSNLLSKNFQSLSSLSVLINYLQQLQPPWLKEAYENYLQAINTDIKPLIKHGDFLNQKLGFQLQSTLGLINIEQNHIIKTFTVLAMVFMPPTLVASIYGMNFHNMPELSSAYGYPIALIVMLASSILPYRFFKKKGWV